MILPSEKSNDANGNPIARGGTALPVAETPFVAQYDSNNRMTQFNGNALTYDANGNLLSRAGAGGTTTYTWDARNELVAITGPFGAANFAYDSFGRRISRTINGLSTGYLYDGWQEVGELSGASVGTTYLTGLEIDELLARYNTTGTRTLLTDGLGSVQSEVQGNQGVSSVYSYSAYGQASIVGAGEGFSPRYAGHEVEASGLIYLRYRYYDPTLKRFINEDPIGLSGGFDVYSYVQDDPTALSDPSGLDWWTQVYVDLVYSPVVSAVTGAVANVKSGQPVTPESVSRDLLSGSINIPGLPTAGVAIRYALDPNNAKPIAAGIISLQNQSKGQLPNFYENRQLQQLCQSSPEMCDLLPPAQRPHKQPTPCPGGP